MNKPMEATTVAGLVEGFSKVKIGDHWELHIGEMRFHIERLPDKENDNDIAR